MKERNKELEKKATEPKNGNTALGTNVMDIKELNTYSGDHITS
jgi:hypothetical protein